MIDIGKTIRKARQKKGLTQDALAAVLHVTRQAVSNWETGKNQPDLAMLEETAKALDVGMADLLQEGKPEYPRFQRKAIAWIIALGVLTVLLPVDEFLVVPRLIALKGRTYNVRPFVFNGLVALPALRLAFGMLIPAVVSLWQNVQPKGLTKTVLRIASVLLLIPVILTALSLVPAVPAPLSRFSAFILSNPSGTWMQIVCRIAPFCAGFCLYPGFVRLREAAMGI